MPFMWGTTCPNMGIRNGSLSSALSCELFVNLSAVQLCVQITWQAALLEHSPGEAACLACLEYFSSTKIGVTLQHTNPQKSPYTFLQNLGCFPCKDESSERSDWKPHSDYNVFAAHSHQTHTRVWTETRAELEQVGTAERESATLTAHQLTVLIGTSWNINILIYWASFLIRWWRM